MTEKHDPGTPGSRRTARRWWRLVLVAPVVLLLAGLSYYLAANSRPSREKLVWMTPQEVGQALRPGKLLKLLKGSATFWNWYMKGKKQLTMESRLFGFSTNASEPKGLPSTVFRNVDGTRCWILSSQEWAVLRPEIEGATGVSTMSVSRVTTLEGGQFSISSGTMKLDSLPKISGSIFDLLVCATSTTGSTASSETNFVMAGRVQLSNGGVMMVSGPPSSAAGGTNYWYVLSSQAIDAAGNAIKL